MNPLNSIRWFVRRFTPAFLALFILAIALSQPHRVHHFFEDSEHAHHHGETDSKDGDHSKAPGKVPQAECVVQAVSQHCSAIPVAVAQVPIITIAGKARRPVLRRWIYRFSSSPFLQRAPPATTSSFSL